MTESGKPTAIWWLSFADDTGCLGICIVEAPVLEDPDDEFIIAVRRSHQHKINPGCQCKGTRIPEDLREKFENDKNKFFTVSAAGEMFHADTEANLKKKEEAETPS